MAPAPAAAPSGAGGGDKCGRTASDRKGRKPLVEKKRRARINESLQELRALIADSELQSKMENAEVLEMTVKRVESILQSRTQDADAVSREARERFAAGYIQCMHDVHTFVSSCPGVEPAAAAELLHHLLQSMPLHDEERLRGTLPQSPGGGGGGGGGPWPASEGLFAALVSPAPSSSSSFSSSSCSSCSFSSSSSSSSFSSSCDELSSDMDDTDSEQSHMSSAEEADALDASSTFSKSVWRPW